MDVFQALEGPEPDKLPGTPILTEKELDFYLRSIQRRGFTPGINWSRNWRAGRDLDQTARAPSLMIAAKDDLALLPELTHGMEAFVPDLERHVVADCGHFSIEEKPGEVTSLVVDWLRRRFPAERPVGPRSS